MTQASPTSTVRARQPLLNEADAARALDVAERLYAAALPPIARAPGPPESVSRYGGAALVAEALARAGRGDDARVRAALRDALVFASDRLSLFDGAGGLLVVLDAIDPERAALRDVRAKLRDALAASLRGAALGDPASSAAYELIGGASGRALALACATGEPVPKFETYANAVADAVERALASGDANAAAVNLGTSHGLPGVLAALNAAPTGERDVARRYVELLLRTSHVVDGAHRWGAVWRPDVRPSARRAWCYQTVGVAALLGASARIDGDGALQTLASRATAAVLDADEPDETPWDDALCHGRAGTASLAWTFPGDDALVQQAQRLARNVLDEADARTSRPAGTSPDGEPPPKAGFVDGMLGIAQFLVDAATAQERRWLPLFGLAPD